MAEKIFEFSPTNLVWVFLGFMGIAWISSLGIERLLLGKNRQAKRAKIISWLLFPGIILHEAAHAFFYLITNFQKPVRTSFLYNDRGLPNGAVTPDKMESPTASLLVAFGPLLILAPLALMCCICLITYWSILALDLQIILIYLSIVLLCCARPSRPDLNMIKSTTRENRGALAREGYAILTGIACIYLLWRTGMATGFALYWWGILLVVSWHILFRLIYKTPGTGPGPGVHGMPSKLPPRIVVPPSADNISPEVKVPAASASDVNGFEVIINRLLQNCQAMNDDLDNWRFLEGMGKKNRNMRLRLGPNPLKIK